MSSEAPDTQSGAGLEAQLNRFRLESDALHDVIAVIASSPDLDRVLSGVVDVLTRVTRCHACFIYLRVGDRLRLAAASPIYGHVVGHLELGVDEGLAGWALRRNSPALIREKAMHDPRNKYVPELEEEHFQSLVAVPIPSRGGDGTGVMVLNTVAPREFDEGTLNLLSRTAPLVASAIENAQLYEQARRRVDALTSLTELGHRIAAVTGREELFSVAVSGVRSLLGCAEVRLYRVEAERRRLEIVATDPRLESGPGGNAGATLLPLELLHRVRDRSMVPAAEVLGLPLDTARVHVAPVMAGGEQLGLLVAAGDEDMPDDAEELLRVVANQVAVGLNRAELIERLTDENIVRDLFEALESGRLDEAEARARQARTDLDRACVLVEVLPAKQRDHAPSWPDMAAHVTSSLRRLALGAICDEVSGRIRAHLPLTAGGTTRELQLLDDALVDLAADQGVVMGRSDIHHGAAEARDALREASDAAMVALALLHNGGAMPYRDLGAYRYLVHVSPIDAVSDPYLDHVRHLRDYDERRATQLVMTLEQYLAERGNVTEAARKLTVHPNTLRQRLDRIETLTGLELARADGLALALAVKFARLTA